MYLDTGVHSNKTKQKWYKTKQHIQQTIIILKCNDTNKNTYILYVICKQKTKPFYKINKLSRGGYQLNHINWNIITNNNRNIQQIKIKST